MSELDDLKTPSLTEVEPVLELKNIFKPTSKNMIILGTLMKLIAVGVVTGCATLFATDPHYATILIIGAVIFGALGEGLILFTKQAPFSTLVRAAEDIKLNPQQLAPLTDLPTTESQNGNVSNN